MMNWDGKTMQTTAFSGCKCTRLFSLALWSGARFELKLSDEALIDIRLSRCTAAKFLVTVISYFWCAQVFDTNCRRAPSNGWLWSFSVMASKSWQTFKVPMKCYSPWLRTHELTHCQPKTALAFPERFFWSTIELLQGPTCSGFVGDREHSTGQHS